MAACMAAQERAFEESQKYKEGKFILEKARLMKVRKLYSVFHAS